jgi:hypothetical protein
MLSAKIIPFVCLTCVITLALMGRSTKLCLYGDIGNCFIDWDLIKVLSRSLIIIPIVKHICVNFNTSITLFIIYVCVWEICEKNITGSGDSVINSIGDIIVSCITASFAFRLRGDISTGCGLLIEILNTFLLGKSFVYDLMESCTMILPVIFTLYNSSQQYHIVIKCVNYIISKINDNNKPVYMCRV